MIATFDFLCAFFLEYILVRNSSLSLRYSLFAGFILATSFVVALFSYRAFEEENLAEYTEQFTRTLISLSIAVVLTALFFSIFRSKLAFRPTALTFAVLSIIIPFLNTKIYHFQLSKRKPKEFIVFVEKEKHDALRNVLHEVQERSKGRYIFKTFVDGNDNIVKLDEIIEYSSSVSFLVTNAQQHEFLRSYLYTRQLSCEVLHIADVIEDTLKRIPMQLIGMYQQYYEIKFQQIKDSPVKRVFDIFVALFGVIITSPLLLIAMLLVLIEDGRPVLFKQKRVGRYGKLFTFIKVRTLKEEKTKRKDPNENIEKRALKVGKFLRLTRLDELPQFWLVLKGDMSIVGPRPEMVEYHEKYMKKIPFYNYRLNLKPGLTGWAQINYKHTSTLEEYIKKTEYDLYYIKNQSLLLDIQIILQTLEAVFWRRGAR